MISHVRFYSRVCYISIYMAFNGMKRVKWELFFIGPSFFWIILSYIYDIMIIMRIYHILLTFHVNIVISFLLSLPCIFQKLQLISSARFSSIYFYFYKPNSLYGMSGFKIKIIFNWSFIFLKLAYLTFMT